VRDCQLHLAAPNLGINEAIPLDSLVNTTFEHPREDADHILENHSRLV
jgi:hypothetical protein